MRSAVLKRAGGIEIEESGVPPIGEGEALVEMRAVGLCGSDTAAFRGCHPFREPPVVLGHEGAGRVAEAADGTIARGTKVAVLPLAFCGRCGHCERGLSHLCAYRRLPGAGLPGLLAQYVVLPRRALVPLPGALSYAQGALIEPAAVAWHTVGTAGVRFGTRLAVLGAGTIGHLTAAVARLHGAEDVLVTDVRPRALGLAARATGCRTLDARYGAVAGEGRAGAFDAVVVASGHQGCMDEALALCRPRGTVVVLPMFGETVRAGLNPLVLKEIRVKGSSLYTPGDFRAAAGAVARGALDVRPLITAEPAPLATAQDAFEELDRGSDVMKVLLDPAR
ncbi:alcohol dehydrogenase catalytic domain-containing protein [Streptomyces sp. NBC_01220]|uniref:zinc-dependent alcohol dehydrogenase n=1 Tax=Streptomyces sp. NBC_01220 TaxID=2903781 RepID=UPI00352EB613|nr:alcohol dehydrogenase catalytic domain-containing protein [Streptomyces sp. NBC_01220]